MGLSFQNRKIGSQAFQPAVALVCWCDPFRVLAFSVLKREPHAHPRTIEVLEMAELLTKKVLFAKEWFDFMMIAIYTQKFNA